MLTVPSTVRRKREVANQDQVLEEGPAEREQKEEMITDWKKIAWRSHFIIGSCFPGR
jgi:hypothetical protein